MTESRQQLFLQELMDFLLFEFFSGQSKVQP